MIGSLTGREVISMEKSEATALHVKRHSLVWHKQQTLASTDTEPLN